MVMGTDPLSAADVYDATHAYLRALIGAHPIYRPGGSK